MRKFLLVTSSLLALAACDLSPDFTLPTIGASDGFKENAAPDAAAKPGDAEAQPTIAPADDIQWKRVDEKAKIDEFAWWRMFNDPALNALEEQALKDNPSLEVAAQRVISARAQAGIAESNLYPTLDVGFGPRRQRPAAADVNANIPPGFNVETKPYTTYTLQGSLSYELDLFGKYRNTARAAAFDADAQANNYRAARLALQSDIAQAYFQRAALQRELDILTRTIADRKDSLGLTQKKRDVGEIDDLEVSTQETDLATVQSDRDSIAQQLSLNEHLIATLLGISPSEFKSIDAKIDSLPPQVPAGLPSMLLTRRPDIQAAAKSIAAANARIGAARAGYFPDISLSTVYGYTSPTVSRLFDAGNKTWSIGPLSGGTMLTQPLFEGGLLSNTLDARHADYDAAAANYKASVLQAFREVEDQLSDLQHLHDQAANRTTATRAAKHAYDIAKQRYDVGYSSHLEYLDAERQYLAAQRAQVQVLGQRYIETIQLVKALGGSWQTPPTPAPAPVKDTPAALDNTVKKEMPTETAPATPTPDKPTEQSTDEPGFFDNVSHWFDSTPEEPKPDASAPTAPVAN